MSDTPNISRSRTPSTSETPPTDENSAPADARPPRSARRAQGQDSAVSRFTINTGAEQASQHNLSRTAFHRTGSPEQSRDNFGASNDSLISVSIPLPSEPYEASAQTGAESELFHGWMGSEQRRSPTASEASHFSIDSFQQFVDERMRRLQQLKYEAGEFITETGERLRFDKKNRILRDSSNNPIDIETMKTTSLEQAKQTPLFRVDATLKLAGGGAENTANSQQPAGGGIPIFSPATGSPAAARHNSPDDADGRDRTDSTSAQLSPAASTLPTEQAIADALLTGSDAGDAAHSGLSVNDLGVRPNADPVNKDFKELDWVDKHYIWMRNNPAMALLSTVAIVPIYHHVRALFRHGFSLNHAFAQTKTPHGPINDVYFQDRQSDRSQSLRHAMRAALGRPVDLTTDRFKRWLKSAPSMAEGPRNGVIADYLTTASEPHRVNWQSSKAWSVNRDMLEKDNCQAFADRVVEAGAMINTSDSNAVLVSVDTMNVTGGVDRQWVAFRKDPDKDGDWTLLDASRFVIDAKNGYQPKISPMDYVRHKFERGEVEGFSMIYSLPHEDAASDTGLL